MSLLESIVYKESSDTKKYMIFTIEICTLVHQVEKINCSVNPSSLYARASNAFDQLVLISD